MHESVEGTRTSLDFRRGDFFFEFKGKLYFYGMHESTQFSLFVLDRAGGSPERILYFDSDEFGIGGFELYPPYVTRVYDEYFEFINAEEYGFGSGLSFYRSDGTKEGTSEHTLLPGNVSQSATYADQWGEYYFISGIEADQVIWKKEHSFFQQVVRIDSLCNLNGSLFTEIVHIAREEPGPGYIIAYRCSNDRFGIGRVSLEDLVSSTGAQDEISGYNLQLFPNPAGPVVGIRSVMQFTQAEVRDITGRVVYKNHFSALQDSTEQVLDVSGLPEGLYILTVSDNSEQRKQSARLLIRR